MKIDKHIPLPRPWATGMTATLKKLKVGESFHFDGPLSSPQVLARRLGIKVVVRAEKNGCRAWRVASKDDTQSPSVPNLNQTTNMTEHDIETTLLQLEYQTGEDGDPIIEQLKSAASFEDHGIMTRNRGVVFRMKDGSEFQITIVRSN